MGQVREFAKVGPKFWQGKTGKELKRRGSKALVMALYLMTSPHSNMLGLYNQPLLYAAHETGLGVEGASEGLQDCIDAGFCAYDHESEMVWVFEMAKYQIGESLSYGDKRCKGIQKDYDSLPENPFLGEFYDRYAEAYNLSDRRGEQPQMELGFEGASKPHRSKEKEKEKEKESKGLRQAPSERASKKCPKDFVVTDELRSWARKNAGAVDLQTETEKFRDHTFTSARSDWDGTWRNWMRRSQESLSGPNSRSGAKAAADIFG